MKKWSYDTAKDHAVAPLDRMRSTKREQGTLSTLAHDALGALMWAYYRTYHRLRIINREKLPTRPPFVIVANHTSHVDAFILSTALVPEARSIAYSVAAGDVFFTTHTTSALSATLVNALPLWRKKITAHALEELRQRLEAGHSGLILFPEGSRSRDGKPQRFKPGIGMIVAGTSVPVYPCHIEGAFEALPPDRKIPRPHRITIRVGDALRFDTTPNSREGWDSVASAIRTSIGAMSPTPWPAEFAADSKPPTP